MDMDMKSCIGRRTIAIGLSASAALLATGCTQLRPTAPGWTGKPAFSIVEVQIHDGQSFGDYVTGHTATIARRGGRFLVAGARADSVEGSRPPRTMVIHQWPDAQTFLDWYNSPEYAPWKTKRHAAATADVILAQGLIESAPSSNAPPGFSVVDIDVRDAEPFSRYVQGHMPSLAAAGGQFLAAGGRIEVIEGQWRPRRVILHRWPSTQAFRDWYASEAYRPWKELRHSASSANVALVAGLSEAQKASRKLP
jgi:uncharacterized protein (DUF1330 family)